MTTTYDPTDPAYLDESDVRGELTRAFDICQSCRLCVGRCGSFPTLFELLDRHDDPDAGRLTPAEQDSVADECFQCKQCAIDCPYTAARHQANLDFPRLMLRARAMQYAGRHTPARSRVATQLAGRADLVGRVATSVAPFANRIVGAKPGSMLRRLTAMITGVSARRRLPTFATLRFGTWFERRPGVRLARPRGRVTVFPTCLVEYREPRVGMDLVAVYERNGIECAATAAGCCGAPWLHAGDIRRFTKAVEKNVAVLAAEVRAGTDIVVPQPTCSYVLKHEYPRYATDAQRCVDAELVAAHTFDACEYLMAVHEADDSVLDTDFDGETFDEVTYHEPCNLRAQDVGHKSRDLLRLTGARVRLLQQCSVDETGWGLRAEHDERSLPFAAELASRVDRAGGDVVVGDSHLANTAIAELTGRTPLHPLQVLARAYGVSPD